MADDMDEMVRTTFQTPWQPGDDPISWLAVEIPTWKCYPDGQQVLRAMSPTYDADGIFVTGLHPHEVAERVRALERLIALALGRMGRLPVGAKIAGELIPVWDPASQRIVVADSPLPMPPPAPPSALPPRATEESPAEEPPPLTPALQLERARSMGYTGDICSQCGSTQMKRSGSCATCEVCGSTSGCS